MVKKNLFLALLSGLCYFSMAAGNLSSEPPKTLLACDLPAPTNFHVVSVGASYVNLAWNSVPGASKYLLRTFDSNDQLVSSQNPTDTTATVDGLLPGGSYYSLLSTECDGGVQGSVGEATVARVNYIVLIVELIVQASGTGGVMTENIGFCEEWHPWNETDNSYWIEVKEELGNKVALFQVYRAGFARVEMGGPVQGGTLNAKHTNEAGVSPPPRITIFYYAEIKINNGPALYRLTFEVQPTAVEEKIRICALNLIGSGYSIRLIRLNPPEGPGERDTNGKNSMPDSKENDLINGSVLVRPNPFSDRLDVFTPGVSKGHVNLQLVDLNGSVVLEGNFEAGQELCSLPTGHLSPGFYFLRMGVSGKVKTFKVIKSE